MSTSKKSFILYLDQKELFEKLPDETAGKLIKHIFKYVNCENPEADDLIVDVAFASIKQSLKRDLKKWETQTEQRRQAGLKSAEKRANEKQRKSTSVKARSTNSTDSVNVSVSDSVSDSSNKRFSPPSVQDINCYFQEKGINNLMEAEKFFNYYESNGWKVGRNKMKNWKAACSNWIKNYTKPSTTHSPKAFSQ